MLIKTNQKLICVADGGYVCDKTIKLIKVYGSFNIYSVPFDYGIENIVAYKMGHDDKLINCLYEVSKEDFTAILERKTSHISEVYTMANCFCKIKEICLNYGYSFVEVYGDCQTLFSQIVGVSKIRGSLTKKYIAEIRKIISIIQNHCYTYFSLRWISNKYIKTILCH